MDKDILIEAFKTVVPYVVACATAIMSVFMLVGSIMFIVEKNNILCGIYLFISSCVCGLVSCVLLEYMDLKRFK